MVRTLRKKAYSPVKILECILLVKPGGWMLLQAEKDEKVKATWNTNSRDGTRSYKYHPVPTVLATLSVIQACLLQENFDKRDNL
jgi:hypothetical protein